MAKSPTKNLHVPLPEPVYRRLRAEAERTSRPATELAREAIGGWLAEQERRAVHESIQAYAREVAASADDLDADLEHAAAEELQALDEDDGDAAQ